MKKVLFIGDGVTPTGFSTVNHNIIRNLPKHEYEVHHLAINYHGDPHDKDWKIYPAVLGGDMWGFGRVKQFFENNEWDGVFILNDVWVLKTYLEKIKELNLEKLPPIVTYFPVDSLALDSSWFKDFDIVHRTVVYTNFAKEQVKVATGVPEGDFKIDIIPHGVDTDYFYEIGGTKRERKSKLYPHKEEFLDSFIVLNANRNQPRKRMDITMEGFAMFAQGKPENVKVYTHCGIQDVGFDIFRLATRYGIDKRLVVTNEVRGVQKVPLETLNVIYNATDVGINTSTGEGWGLTNHEHAATGAPQIVPNHSACRELYEDCGLLIPINQYLTNNDTLTVGGLIHPEGLAMQLDTLYNNKDLYDELSKKSFEKFTSEEYQWDNIVEKYWIPLFEETFA